MQLPAHATPATPRPRLTRLATQEPTATERAAALGSAPLSGFRSGRFSARGNPEGGGRTWHVESHVEGAAQEATSGDDEELAATCGELRIHVMCGPALPQGSGVMRGPLPRSFFDACRPLSAPNGSPVAWPACAEAPPHLRFFAFPSTIVERLCIDASDAYGYTFSFTDEMGSLRWGCAVAGADPSHRDGLNATCVVALCNWPLVRMLLGLVKQLFLLEQRRRAGWRAFGVNVTHFARALASSKHEVAFLIQHPLWLPTPLAPILDAVHYSADDLLLVFVATVLERPILMHTATVSKLMPAAAALSHLISPLSFSGTFIPFLPASLHPEPATLINFSPTPFIIGVERLMLASLQPLAPHVLTIDLDTGELNGEEALAELRALAKAPPLQQLHSGLRRFCAGGEETYDERALQAELLSFVRDLTAVAAQRLLHGSADATDHARASECQLVAALTADVLRSTADLPGAETVTKRVLMCQADALVRVCQKEPVTPTCAFLAEAYQSRTVREYLMTPPSALSSPGAGSFADAAWMASDLDALQSITEHSMALDAVQALVEERLVASAPQLQHARLLSPRTADFQQRFEVGVNETVLGSFPCAIHFRGALRHGVLHVSTRHVCFETNLHRAASTKVPLLRVSAVERHRDPVFHLVPNAIKLGLEEGAPLVFGAFPDRDEVFDLLCRCVPEQARRRRSVSQESVGGEAG